MGLFRSDPALGQVLNTLAEFYLEQGNIPDAEDHFHRAREVRVPKGRGAPQPLSLLMPPSSRRAQLLSPSAC